MRGEEGVYIFVASLSRNIDRASLARETGDNKPCDTHFQLVANPMPFLMTSSCVSQHDG